ncbi:HD-GYP domain-containing protein [Parasphingorhabdus sp.]|uniref:HD-GYP domain-containing protein n=1 Tax=Parasphingorhabdus sp. TaxID=2709688 RepID=UPI003D2DE0DE
MLHRIETSQLELGMFIDDIEASWLESPFWRSRLVLTRDEQIEALVAKDIQWVTIDDNKGKGLPSSREPRANAAKSQNSEKRGHIAQPARAVKRPAPSHSQPYIPPPGEQRFTRLTPRERAAEVRKAKGAIKRSRTAVMNLFQDARLGNAVKSKKMATLIEQIANSVAIDPTIILNIARLKTKDEYTYLHSVAVSALMINLARKLRFPEAQIPDIGMAGLLHDVGKISIPDSILLKPGKLDEQEWTTVRLHPQKGHEILLASDGVCDMALEVCLRHHEKMDGTGYPGRLDGDDLSLITRMASICDVYDAITSQRPYNKPQSASQALKTMQSCSGHFDQLILRDFAESLGIVPIGTLVRMDRAELAVVIGESPSDYAAPIVRTFRALDSDLPIVPQDIDTGRKRSRKVISIEDPDDWGFADWSTVSADLLAEEDLT